MGIIGKKLGMTQVFDEKRNVVPVTVIKAGPCVVIRKKTPERDGYTALQLGFEEIKDKRVSRPLLGYFRKYKVKPQRILREFPWEDIDSVKEGDVVLTINVREHTGERREEKIKIKIKTKRKAFKNRGLK